MKNLIALSTLMFSLTAFAQAPVIYKVEGMTCGNCVKAIKSQVCKLADIAQCEVSVGEVKLTPKPGQTIDQAQIQAAMSKAGEYKIISGK